MLKTHKTDASPYAVEQVRRAHLLWECAKMRACVLIVDDHAVIRRMLHALFEADDIEVREAQNGAEGVKSTLLRLPAAG